MNNDEYDQFVQDKILGVPSKERFALALSEEVGELCGKLKRVMRGDYNEPEGELYELGDILFYLSAYASECGSTLNEVISLNMSKLEARKNKGVIKGTGDYR